MSAKMFPSDSKLKKLIRKSFENNLTLRLDKLAFAASQVRGLQLELEALQPQLKIASEENEAMMKVINLIHAPSSQKIRMTYRIIPI